MRGLHQTEKGNDPVQCNAADVLPPEPRRILTQSACRFCDRRKECPYSCDRSLDRALRRAASQRETVARLLSAEAERLLQEISRADQIRCLLRADEALEHTLSELLYAELRAGD